MSNNPLVSILINNYNYGRFLSEAIDSALKQSYSNIEVIVVDDGSTDNSQEIIKSYGEKIVPILKQ
ncbi:MAG: glycosyltransferase, partial [Symploca sp. SIO2D2]|nr:glycosyltransferase [Symploca sp. SIO2D2]